jgi:pimeloyl-ACP methyl ester carboxylesterase
MARSAASSFAVDEFYIHETGDSMYVQRWNPPAGAAHRRAPIVMVPGGSHTGAVWTTTPLVEPGWAQFFARAGWTVYVVDWPGVGRSGMNADFLTLSPARIANALLALLERTGPAIFMGHSIGGMLSFLAAKERPERVVAVCALASAAFENVQQWLVRYPKLDETAAVMTPRDRVKTLFANSPAFPIEAFDNYYASLVPFSPRILNATMGHTKDFHVDDFAWARNIAIQYIVAEHDAMTDAEPSAALVGAPCIRLERDWGLAGHGHLFPIERNNHRIAERIAERLAAL